jgi:hypothetical protein
MPELEERLRRDVPRILEPADSDGVFEAVQAKRSRRQRVRRTERISLVVVVALVTAGGAFALYRAFGSSSQPAQPPIPSASPSAAPSQSASPTEVPTSPPGAAVPGYAAECQASQVVADFDGDGQHDTATIAKNHCFHHPGQEPIPTTPFNMAVSWGGGAAGIVALEGCERACVAFGAGDLNGDGAAELWVIVDRSGSRQFLEVFELPQSEAFGRAAEYATATGEATEEVARFAMGGTATAYQAVGCVTPEGSVEHLVANVNHGGTTWMALRRTYRFESIGAPPFGVFRLISSERFTRPFDLSVPPEDVFGPSGTCWGGPSQG